MEKQNEQQSSLRTGSPSASISPAYLNVPSRIPPQDIQGVPPTPPQTTETQLALSVVPPQTAIDLPVATPACTPIVGRERFPNNLPLVLNLVLGQDGKAYSIQYGAGNPYVVPVGSKHLSNVVREYAQQEGENLRQGDLRDINAMLQAHAEMAAIRKNVWYRVAPVKGGVEIDMGDESHARIRITAGNVAILTSGSDSLFYRSAVSLPMVMPADRGDLNLLKKYLNLHPASAILLIGWITFVMAHPKLSTSKYPLLQLSGSQGCGKSSLCNNILLQLIDPSRVGLQLLPNNSKDLAIAAQNAHVLYYDNVRGFSQSMADILCIAATGGVISSRQLYTDADQQLLNLHVALVLNGIHAYIDQPDLAQRCLPLHLQPIPEETRKSDTALAQEFHADLPFIMRGLFDLIAEIFKHLPNAQPTNPERMIDFVRWLAAMEMAQGIPAGVYQTQYSDALRNGQLDSLQENVLAAAILELAEELQGDRWTGTPEKLLNELNVTASRGTLRSKDWPVNAISLSKKLAVLAAGLKSQGIDVVFSRGKQRSITITSTQNGGM